MPIDLESPSLHVIVEGLFGDHYIPIDKFNPRGYLAMIRAYRQMVDHLPPLEEREWERCYVNLALWDARSGEESDNPDVVRQALQDRGKWLDKLPLSIVL